MSRFDTPDAFYLELEDSPGDALTLLALADWFEEQGDADNAACLRWTARRGLRPFRFGRDAGLSVPTRSFRPGWHWWAVEDPVLGHDWGFPRDCRLPRSLWDKLRHSFDITPLVFKDYETARAAYEALFAAWGRVPPSRRGKSS